MNPEYEPTSAKEVKTHEIAVNKSNLAEVICLLEEQGCVSICIAADSTGQFYVTFGR